MLELNATLVDGLEKGYGKPFFTCRLKKYNIVTETWTLIDTYTVNRAILGRLRIELDITENLLEEVDTIVASRYAVDFERGLTISGTKYSIVSNDYYIVSAAYSEFNGGTRIIAELLPAVAINPILFDGTVREALEDIFAQLYSTNLSFDYDRDIWYDWEGFDPEEYFSWPDCRLLVSHMEKNFFSYFFPRWYKLIMIYSSVSNVVVADDGNYTPFAHAKVTQFLWPDKLINLSWEDENGVQSYAPDGQEADWHSLGKYSAASDISAADEFDEWGRVFIGPNYQYIQRPDLRLEQGDILKVSTDGFDQVRTFELVEYYKTGSKPAWVQIVKQLPYHPNAAYNNEWYLGILWNLIETPGFYGNPLPPEEPPDSRYHATVNQGRFGSTGVLANVDANNVQSALEKINAALVTDHGGLSGLADDDHTQYIRHALAAAVNDFLVASGAGVYVKKTLAQTKTLLGLPEDHGTLGGLADDDHRQYILHSLSTALNDFLIGTAVGTYVKKTLAETKTLLGLPEDHGALGGLADDDHTQYIRHALATAVNDFLVASGSGAFVKKTLAETKTLLGIPQITVGTSFPGSPSAGDLYYRSDLGLQFHYTGSEWESQEQMFSMSHHWYSTDAWEFMTMRQDMTYKITRVSIQTYPQSPNNGSNYWSVYVYSEENNGWPTTLHYSFNTAADTDDATTLREGAASTASPGAYDYRLVITHQKTGSPGFLNCFGTIYFRWIAT